MSQNEQPVFMGISSRKDKELAMMHLFFRDFTVSDFFTEINQGCELCYKEHELWSEVTLALNPTSFLCSL